MVTRHRVDTSVRYDRLAALPEHRDIEIVDLDPLPTGDPPTTTVDREPYLASSGLEEAVNVAIALGRPLLLQGDPGAGKTRLAHAVAYALGLPLEQMYIKSTSLGRDLLYTYDAVRRLYDAQLAATGGGSGADPSQAGRYVRLGPLGRAIARARYGRRSVVLIDEIDKADLDFPNDLLRELDRLAFDVPEAPGLSYAVPDDRPDLRPIIIVTNNEEKALPGAFLRRCVFYYLEFPDDVGQLNEILALHGVADAELCDSATRMLLRLRELDLSHKPGLSELIDWVGYLQERRRTPADLAQLPYPGTLLKQRTDQARARKLTDP
ncbi:AAA family ATPase [Micromonospora sp. DT233]|uniref:AAA family ATPase n=1 Tax=Micromonospora sp. DT233 TaxID=3393432 RepID=UPI003CEE1EB3